LIVDNRRFVVTSTFVSNRRPLSDEGGDKIYDIVIVPPLLRSPKYKANIARL
jgi:hypothetical protein